MRQPSKQIQLPFNPSQHLVRRCEKSNVAQTPQISNRRSAQVAQQARMRHEEIDHENQGKRGGPCWDLVFQDREIWVDAIRFHRFVAEQEKHPHASSDRSAIEAKHDPLEECVETARQKAEGAGEQEEGDDGSMFGFEAFQEWNEGDGVQQEVEKVSMEEGVSIKAVHWRNIISFSRRDDVGEGRLHVSKPISCGINAPHWVRDGANKLAK